MAVIEASPNEDELWIIGTTFSQALRKEGTGLAKICEALSRNPQLTVHIAFAEFKNRLYGIARDEIGAIYSSEGSRAVGFTPEHVQTLLITNRFEDKSLKKFLYPPHLDYLRKLNDMYAALTYLYHMAKDHDFQARIKCHTYTGRPSLRATLVKGKRRQTLDFLHTYEGHIGMTGTLFRVEGMEQDKSLIWDKACKELKDAMELDENGVALSEVAREISEVLRFRLDEEIEGYIKVPDQYFEPENVAADFLEREWAKFDTRIQKFCNEKGYGEDP